MVIGLFLWAGFAIAAIFLLAGLVAVLLARLFRKDPYRPASVSRSVPVTFAVLSVLAFCYAAFIWFGFPPGDASRGISTAPPLAFAVLSSIAAVVTAFDCSRGRSLNTPASPVT